jgi:hypothetical protein
MYTQPSVAQPFQVYTDAQSTTLLSYQQGVRSPRPVIAEHRVRVLLAVRCSAMQCAGLHANRRGRRRVTGEVGNRNLVFDDVAVHGGCVSREQRTTICPDWTGDWTPLVDLRYGASLRRLACDHDLTTDVYDIARYIYQDAIREGGDPRR